MKEAVTVTHSKAGVKLLWASCRELYNVIQADEVGADIITCPADVVKKVNNNLGRDINGLSVDTVKDLLKISKVQAYLFCNSIFTPAINLLLGVLYVQR